MKKRARTYWACKYYKSTGAPYGGCKHPKATGACLYEYIDQCQMSERRQRITISQQKQREIDVLLEDKYDVLNRSDDNIDCYVITHS